jgi:hypothetical protein
MDQYLVAMVAVILFAVVAVLYAAMYDRRNEDPYEPNEHGESPL